MSLVDALIHAVLVAAATVLPVSASGHDAITRFWLGDDPAFAGSMVAVGLGAAIAMAAAARARLGRACRAVARFCLQPRKLLSQVAGREAASVVIAAAVSTGVALAIASPIRHAGSSPTAVGLGLLLTALSLGTAALAPAPTRVCPTAIGSLWVGLAHGLGTAPGMSQVGAAFVVANWLGVRGWRAVEFAFMATVATTLFDVVRSVAQLQDPSQLASLSTVVALLAAMVAAGLAAHVWRRLSEQRQTVWLVAWLLPLAVATLGYGHAAPGALRSAPATSLGTVAPRVAREAAGGMTASWPI